MKDNAIADIERVVPLLDTMGELRELVLINNPITMTPKYRDQIVLLS